MNPPGSWRAMPTTLLSLPVPPDEFFGYIFSQLDGIIFCWISVPAYKIKGCSPSTVWLTTRSTTYPFALFRCWPIGPALVFSTFVLTFWTSLSLSNPSFLVWKFLFFLFFSANSFEKHMFSSFFFWAKTVCHFWFYCGPRLLPLRRSSTDLSKYFTGSSSWFFIFVTVR